MKKKCKGNEISKDIFRITSSKKKREQINDFLIGGKIAFNDFKMNLSSKFMINKLQKTKALSSSSEISFFHRVSPWMKYSLVQNQNALKFYMTLNIVNNFLLISNIFIDNTENISSIPISFISKYKFKNNLSLQCGIKDYDPMKEKSLCTICAGFTKPFSLWENNHLFTGFLLTYSLKEKFFKSNEFGFNICNTYLNTLLNITFNKKSKNSIAEKLIKFKGEINSTGRLTLGTEVHYDSEDNKGTKLQLFSNYIIDQFTNFITKWDDKDKSITIKMKHDFRGLAKLKIFGKFTPLEVDKNEKKKIKIPSFGSKIGINVDIFEHLL